MKNSLGNKLFNLRKQNKLTQELVAEQLSVTRQTVSNWESGATKPDIEQIKDLSRLYKLSVDELIDNDVKEILAEKISKVEKSTNFVRKLIIIALIIGMLIIIDDLSRTTFWGSAGHSIFCFLNETEYTIYIEAQGDKTTSSLFRWRKSNGVISEEMPVTRIDVYPKIGIPDLEKYNKFYQIENVVYVFFESNGGSCY